MISTTVGRVPAHTSGEINARIAARTRQKVARAGRSPAEINRRLRELDEEWDIERTLEANAATASLIGVCLAATVDRKWLLLPGAVAAFLLQHAVQGWCPPMPVFRRLGVRTAREIEEERMALKALRGDFEDVRTDPEAALQAAMR